MNEPVQLTLDFMTTDLPQEREETACYHNMPISMQSPVPFNFSGLFEGNFDFEEKHSANSMAILGDCLSV